jgi:hypothetical protein
MKLSRADDRNGYADAQRKHNGEDQIRIFPEITAKKFDQRTSDRGKNKRAEYRTLAAQQSHGDSRERRVRQRISYHGITPQDQKDSYAWAEN